MAAVVFLGLLISVGVAARYLHRHGCQKQKVSQKKTKHMVVSCRVNHSWLTKFCYLSYSFCRMTTKANYLQSRCLAQGLMLVEKRAPYFPLLDLSLQFSDSNHPCHDPSYFTCLGECCVTFGIFIVKLQKIPSGWR